MPIRPLSLVGDLQQASPGEAVATDPNAITQRARLTLDQVQVTFAGFDDNGASRVLRAIKHRLPLKIFRKTLIRITVIDARSNIFNRRLEKRQQRALLGRNLRRREADNRGSDPRGRRPSAHPKLRSTHGGVSPGDDHQPWQF